jgi:hypothetical protein
MNDQLEQFQSEERGTFGEDSMESTATGLLERPPVRVESPRPVPIAPPVCPGVKPAEPRRSAFDDNEEGEETLFDRHRGKFILAIVVAVGGATAYLMSLPKTTTHMSKAPERMVTVTLPPPPPPPPPKIQPPPEEKMIEQAPVEDEPKPEIKQDEPPPISTGIKGDGPGLSGLSNKGDGSRIGGFGAGGRAAGRWDGYARGGAIERFRRDSQISENSGGEHSCLAGANLGGCDRARYACEVERINWGRSGGFGSRKRGP